MKKLFPLMLLLLAVLAAALRVPQDVTHFERTLSQEALRLDELVPSVLEDEAHWESMARGLNEAGAVALQKIALNENHSQNERTLAVDLLVRRATDFPHLLSAVAHADHRLFHASVTAHTVEATQRDFEAALRWMAASALKPLREGPLADGAVLER